MAKQLANEKTMEKVSSSWRLASKLVDLQTLVMTLLELSFIHVRREENQVVGLLANVGVSDVKANRRGRLEDFEAELWIPRCRQLATYDMGDREQVKGGMREE